MSNDTRMFSVDAFLGLNEAADGDTELKMGQASRMENWYITDGYNLTVRPGIQRVDPERESGRPILAAWSGVIEGEEYLVAVDLDGVDLDGEGDPTDRIFLFGRDEDGKFRMVLEQRKALGINNYTHPVKIFPFGGKLYIMSAGNTVVYKEGSFQREEPYIPLVIAGATPAGGGTMLENLNILTPYRRIDFSADGEATAYVLPEEAEEVTKILIDNYEKDVASAGVFDPDTHTFTFNTAPAKGVGNVEFTYRASEAAAEKTRLKIVDCTLWETFNGSTDTRLFLSGDGSNMCYYTGVPTQGDAGLLYFPAMYEVAVDMASSPVTGLVRHYTKLLVYTEKDGVYTITYEPVTLEDGTVTAGFYLRAAHKEFGNEAMGQIQTVENYPRSISGGSIYEWRITSSFYKDERYARRVSDMVAKTLKRADPGRIVTCDDNHDKTYYVFLNDEEGTVLVNRYALGKEGVWCIYKSALCQDVRFALMQGGDMVFMTMDDMFYFSRDASKDVGVHLTGDAQTIRAIWESGFMDFGAAYRKKYSSRIYVSILPETSSWLTVTASTDRRESYTEKSIGSNVFSFANANFGRWSFNMNRIPKINRIRLKVKKFVYYKLIFKVEGLGDRATILGYDQQVRFASMVK